MCVASGFRCILRRDRHGVKKVGVGGHDSQEVREARWELTEERWVHALTFLIKQDQSARSRARNNTERKNHEVDVLPGPYGYGLGNQLAPSDEVRLKPDLIIPPGHAEGFGRLAYNHAHAAP